LTQKGHKKNNNLIFSSYVDVTTPLKGENENIILKIAPFQKEKC
jgi:hypothetical protein